MSHHRTSGLQRFGYPLMLKSRRLAYDGRGNAVIADEAGIPGALKALGATDGAADRLYVEKWVRLLGH